MNKFQMPAMRSRALMAASALAVALLAGCGGGGGSSEAEALDAGKVPASALTSAKAFTEFVGSLPASNTGEGLSLEGVVAPVTETAAPLSVT